jgi:hypothetical protein
MDLLKQYIISANVQILNRKEFAFLGTNKT